MLLFFLVHTFSLFEGEFLGSISDVFDVFFFLVNSVRLFAVGISRYERGSGELEPGWISPEVQVSLSNV